MDLNTEHWILNQKNCTYSQSHSNLEKNNILKSIWQTGLCNVQLNEQLIVGKFLILMRIFHLDSQPIDNIITNPFIEARYIAR